MDEGSGWKEAEVPEGRRRRTRYRVDGELLLVLDQQIEKMSCSGWMVRLRRYEMLGFLARRGDWCRGCGAGDRELPPIDLAKVPAVDLKRSYQIEIDEDVEASISRYRQQLRAKDGKFRLCLSKQRMLRVLVMKGARCQCPLAEWGVAGDGPDAKVKKAG